MPRLVASPRARGVTSYASTGVATVPAPRRGTVTGTSITLLREAPTSRTASASV